ncbi:MAG: hypothetical protein QGH60_21210 [Phycisphaerae bacterium]|jgi:hypothetical protein|nr:hypothetical protein [Phycisphaerae bacterium]
MSLINDALKRADNAKLDKLSETESTPEMPSANYSQSRGRKMLGPITVVCLLLVGGGLVAYRYLGPGDGPGPQAATAETNKQTPPVAAVTPTKPEAAEWVNPAFKDLTPQAANAMRTEVSGAVVKQFFDTGSSLNAYAASLSTAGAETLARAEAKAKAKLKAEAEAKSKQILSAIAAGVDPTKFRVNGIMFNGPDSMAIINQGVYRVGQKVSGAVVESITPSAVVLRVGDKKFRVGM